MSQFRKMPFGKFKGTYIRDLPDDYLDWLETIDLDEPLLTAVEQECWRRANTYRQEPPRQERPRNETAYRTDQLSANERRLLMELIEAGYRALALRRHPDQGGTKEAMTELTVFMSKLRRSLS